MKITIGKCDDYSLEILSNSHTIITIHCSKRKWVRFKKEINVFFGKILFMDLMWSPLTYTKPSELENTIGYFHQAAQFIALTGNSLLPKKADDSHTNMEWLSSLKALVGHPIPILGYHRLALIYDSFSLGFLDENKKIKTSLDLEGLAKTEIMDWLKFQVKELGGDPGLIKSITHYGIPNHKVDENKPFEIEYPICLQELAKARTNALLMLTTFSSKFEQATSVRVWPHHFDFGSYIPLRFDEANNPTKSIGIGFAIPDKEIEAPYFYINYWTADKIEKDKRLPKIESPGIWHNKSWSGPILKISDVAQSKEQAFITKRFFIQGINSSLELINLSEIKI